MRFGKETAGQGQGRPQGEVVSIRKRLSPWSRSGAKRVFDCACVAASFPVLIPVLLAVGLAVRITSRGPVLFLQRRVGRHGRLFTIFKFRTMVHSRVHQTITTAGNQQFTPVGPFLRRWKLDELPQLLNVLRGDMSLVGPRPKLQEHVVLRPLCRPGITGAATLVFAREEAALDRIPKHKLQEYYHDVVLPAKRRLDAEYMAQATFFSDLKLIVDSVLRRWDSSLLEKLIGTEAAYPAAAAHPITAAPADPADVTVSVPVLPYIDRPVAAEQFTNL